jgi:hypothetical protein
VRARAHLSGFTRHCQTLAAAGLFLSAPGVGDLTLRAGPRPWDEYRVILWVGDSVGKQAEKFPVFLERLRELGADTGMVYGPEADPRPWLEHRFPFYVENIVNRGLCLKWNSPVADWDRFVTEWARAGRSETAFVRPYCLDDPHWLDWAKNQMRTAARRFGPHTPLACDIRDELSVTISANPFDYDFAPAALTAFRQWLKTQYAAVGADALAALNAEWETDFRSWEEVRPFSTDRIKQRQASGQALPRGQPDWAALQRLRFHWAEARREPTRWNFAPWADFRTYMDVSLARTLATLRDAARAVDPATPVGIEGTQMPSAWGGYDLWRLAAVLDWVEPYDIGNAREIFGSFMSGGTFLTTVFESDTAPARRRLWHLLLEGDRGCLIWWSEDCLDWNRPDLALTAKGRALAPVLRELKSPLARLFLRAERVRDPIYLHYSQPSIQVAWLLESTVDGASWHRRFSSFEAEHNRHARVRNAWLKALQDLGFSPRFLASAQLEQLRLDPAEPFTLVLPQSLALSDRELARLEDLVRTPPDPAGPVRLVLSDGAPGLFNEHGRLRRASRFDAVFPPSNAARVYAWRGGGGPAGFAEINTAAFPRERLSLSPNPTFEDWLAHQVGRGPVQLPVAARVRVHRFRAGRALLVALERNIEYQMSEDLKQAGGNEALEKPIELTARLAPALPARHIYDLRTGAYLTHGKAWTFTLDPWQPALFALLDEPWPAAEVVARLDAELSGTP